MIITFKNDFLLDRALSLYYLPKATFNEQVQLTSFCQIGG